MPDYTKLAFASTYPVDKVIATYTGSLTVPAVAGDPMFDPPVSTSTTITHNLNRKCLSEMAWSLDNVNFQDAGAIVLSNTWEVTAFQACDTNTTVIYGGNHDTSPKTIYYRLYLIWPS